jgi:hypothetical protein
MKRRRCRYPCPTCSQNARSRCALSYFLSFYLFSISPAPALSLVQNPLFTDGETYKPVPYTAERMAKGSLIAHVFPVTQGDGSPGLDFFVGHITLLTKTGPWMKFPEDATDCREPCLLADYFDKWFFVDEISLEEIVAQLSD